MRPLAALSRSAVGFARYAPVFSDSLPTRNSRATVQVAGHLRSSLTLPATAFSARNFAAALPGGRRARRVVKNKLGGADTKSAVTSNSTKKPSGEDNKVSPVTVVLRDVSLHLPDGTPVLENVSFSLLRGAKIGVVGINGAGKSSLLKVLAGKTSGTEVEGEVVRYKDVRVGMLEQEPDLDPNLSVFENVMQGAQEKWNTLQEYHRLREEMERSDRADAQPADIQAKLELLEVQVQEQKLFDLERRVRRAMDALRCPDDSQEVSSLSGGERRRIALCRLLVTEPELLLLDEPTNHLDAESVAWLENYLAQYRGTVVAITHDRYFLDNITGWMLEVDRGSVIGYKGNYTGFLEAKQKRLALEESEESSRQRMLARELEWIRKSPKGRRAKNVARTKRYEEMIAENRKRRYQAGTIVIPGGPRLGNVVFNVADLEVSVPWKGGKRRLLSDVSFQIAPNSVVGIIGPNGAGKTTLMNILAGLRKPDAGDVTVGSTVRLGYVSQSRDELNDAETVYDCIADGEHEISLVNNPKHGEENTIQTRAFVASFNFRGTDQSKLVGQLSGGERNRAHLAKLLKRAPNVLFLDEPTNDLDLEVLRNLENALEEFAGVAVIVSHDRYFLDRVCTHIIALDGHGGFKFFDGNYKEFAAWQRKQVSKSSPGEEFVVQKEKAFFKKIEAI